MNIESLIDSIVLRSSCKREEVESIVKKNISRIEDVGYVLSDPPFAQHGWIADANMADITEEVGSMSYCMSTEEISYIGISPDIDIEGIRKIERLSNRLKDGVLNEFNLECIHYEAFSVEFDSLIDELCKKHNSELRGNTAEDMTLKMKDNIFESTRFNDLEREVVIDKTSAERIFTDLLRN